MGVSGEEIKPKKMQGKIIVYNLKLAQLPFMPQIKQGLSDLGSCTGRSLHKNELCLIYWRNCSETNTLLFSIRDAVFLFQLSLQYKTYRCMGNGTRDKPLISRCFNVSVSHIPDAGSCTVLHAALELNFSSVLAESLFVIFEYNGNVTCVLYNQASVR